MSHLSPCHSDFASFYFPFMMNAHSKQARKQANMALKIIYEHETKGVTS